MGLLSASLRMLTNARALDIAVVDANGDQITNFTSSVTPPANATITTVTVATTSILLAASNAARRQLIVVNHTGQDLYVAFAATATTAAFTLLLGKEQEHEFALNGYTGDVSAIRASGTGPVRVTEVTT